MKRLLLCLSLALLSMSAVSETAVIQTKRALISIDETNMVIDDHAYKYSNVLKKSLQKFTSDSLQQQYIHLPRMLGQEPVIQYAHKNSNSKTQMFEAGECIEYTPEYGSQLITELHDTKQPVISYHAVTGSKKQMVFVIHFSTAYKATQEACIPALDSYTLFLSQKTAAKLLVILSK